MAMTIARVRAAVDAAGEDTTHLQLHDGDPGEAGTDNVAAEVSGRIAFVFSAADGSGVADQTGTFTITGAGGPYTHVTGWNADEDGTLQFDAECTPAEQFAGAGSLQVTVTVTGSSNDPS